MKLYYDLHIHTALSPCGDEDMTPNNIVNMASLKGLDVIAITDHNSCKNCRAAMEAAKDLPLIVIPGMELCTNEEAHVLCLFPCIDNAEEFDKYVENHSTKIKNNPKIFGNQWIMNSNDEITGEYNSLLSVATQISVNEIAKVVSKFGGVAIPAHIDRPSFSVTAMLGFITSEMGFTNAELSKVGDIDKILISHPYLKDYRILKNSDAHYLENISERENFIQVEQSTAQAVINLLVNC